MKQGLLIWNVILTLVAGYLLITQFSSSRNGSTEGKHSAADTSSAVHKNFRIAYFDMDSVEANYDRVKDVKAELNKKEENINIEMDRLSKDFQQRYNYYQTQAQSKGMTQEQQDAAGQELKSMEDKIKNRKAELDQDYQELVSRVNKEMKSAIEDYLKDYNRTRGFSYIFANEAGLFYYRDSTYNITNEVVRGLNISYRKKTK